MLEEKVTAVTANSRETTGLRILPTVSNLTHISAGVCSVIWLLPTLKLGSTVDTQASKRRNHIEKYECS